MNKTSSVERSQAKGSYFYYFMKGKLTGVYPTNFEITCALFCYPPPLRHGLSMMSSVLPVISNNVLLIRVLNSNSSFVTHPWTNITYRPSRDSKQSDIISLWIITDIYVYEWRWTGSRKIPIAGGIIFTCENFYFLP